MSETRWGREYQRSGGDGAPRVPRGSHYMRHLIAKAAMLLSVCTLLSLGISRAIATSQDPPTQEEQDAEKKDKEEKKSPFAKDVRNIREYDIPDTQLKELIRGSRSHRKQDPRLLKEDVRDPPKPTAEELRRFEELKKQQEIKKEEDLALIDKVIRRQVDSLTQPQKDWYLGGSEGRKSRDAIEQMLDSASGLGSTEKFFAAYKQSLLKFLPELLDNHIWVRVNAMKLLAKLKDERAIKLFCEQVLDPNQHESVKFMAMEGLETLGHKKLITQVNLETLAVNTLLDVLARADEIHPFTRQQAVRALGAIGRPNRVVGGNDVDVALTLLKVLRDPNIRRADRSEAAVLLANLQIPAQADYNYQYVAYEIAQFAADVGAAAANDPTTDDLHSDLYLVDASYALVAEKRPDKMALVERAKKNAQATAKGDPGYIRAAGDHVTKVTVAALKIYKPDVVGAKPAPAKGAAKGAAEELVRKAKDIHEKLKDPNGQFMVQLNALNDFLDSKRPRSMQLTPFIDELGPPPALVGAKSAAPGAAEEAGGPKGELSGDGSGSADRPSQ